MSRSICVFCASSEHIPLSYFDLARELGEEMARRGFRLVFGGGRVGLMGSVARAVHSVGGSVAELSLDGSTGRRSSTLRPTT